MLLCLRPKQGPQDANGSCLSSSARDRIGHRTVAVKKLADPFVTEAVARHMYREIKLLRQLHHENVSFESPTVMDICLTSVSNARSSTLPTSLSLPPKTCTSSTFHTRPVINNPRYLVTELMATDLNAILKAKKVEDQFAQYFMYQIMVRVTQKYTKTPN